LEDSNPGLRYNAYTALAEILNGSIVPEKQFSHADLGKENVTILQVVEAEHPLLSDSLLDKYRYETFENRPVVLNALYPFLRPTAHGAPPPDRVGTSEVRCRTITKLHTDALVALLLSIDPTDQKTAISNDLRANVCRCLAAIFAHQPLPFLHVVEHSSAKGDQGEQISIHQMALKLSILPIIMNILRVRPINRGTVNYRAPTHVLACAMQALMGLTTDVEAKKSMVRDGGIQLLIDCVGGSVKALTADRKNLTEEVIEQQSALLQHTLQVNYYLPCLHG
jgi:hypothetical protein